MTLNWDEVCLPNQWIWLNYWGGIEYHVSPLADEKTKQDIILYIDDLGSCTYWRTSKWYYTKIKTDYRSAYRGVID